MGKVEASRRPSALVRAQHGGAPVKLDPSQRGILSDALREGVGLADELEDKVVEYGRFLLAKVFHDDTTEALDRKTKNPVWEELVRRAGGPTLPLSSRLLYVALRTAAWDRRIHDETFRKLDVGRKELLLPLDEESQLKAAANHVSKLSMTQDDTRQYVAQLRAEAGKPKQPRFTAKTLAAKATKLSEDLGGAANLKRVKKLRSAMRGEERERVVKAMENLREVVAEIVRALKA